MFFLISEFWSIMWSSEIKSSFRRESRYAVLSMVSWVLGIASVFPALQWAQESSEAFATLQMWKPSDSLLPENDRAFLTWWWLKWLGLQNPTTIKDLFICQGETHTQFFGYIVLFLHDCEASFRIWWVEIIMLKFNVLG